ncbi:hypothetical protein [Shewanella sp. MF08487]|uniref:hypothetical protein n=1 Tax=Shewanella sp. MF08487 TaxID=3434873 RepID=UPI003D7B52A8
MNQGALTDECYLSLTVEERGSLDRIRAHYQKSDVFEFGIDETLNFIDRSYEAMGKRFRDRINRETKAFGRHDGELDGVFLVIGDALRTFHGSQFFSDTPQQTAEIHKQHQCQVRKAQQLSDNAFSDILAVVNELKPTSWSKFDEEELKSAIEKLFEVKNLIDKQIDRINFAKRSDSKAEQFIVTVCYSLVWHANIKPTKPLTDCRQKTPLLRFLEVFYPIEAASILSKIYDKERQTPEGLKIGASFIKPV